MAVRRSQFSASSCCNRASSFLDLACWCAIRLSSFFILYLVSMRQLLVTLIWWYTSFVGCFIIKLSRFPISLCLRSLGQCFWSSSAMSRLSYAFLVVMKGLLFLWDIDRSDMIQVKSFVEDTIPCLIEQYSLPIESRFGVWLWDFLLIFETAGVSKVCTLIVCEIELN